MKILFRLIPCSIILITLLQISVVTTEAQQPPTFDQPVLVELLSSSTVTSIEQDDWGFIWIGTTNGLNRFDGKHVKKYFHDPSNPHSLSHNFVSYNAIYKLNGAIWIGTENGLNKYDPQTDSFEHFFYNLSDSTSSCGPSIDAIVMPDSVTIWAGSRNGLCRLNLQTHHYEQFVHEEEDPHSLSYNAVTDLLIDHADRLWVGTMDGLNLFVPEEQHFIRYDPFPASPAGGLSKTIYALISDEEYLWMGTDGSGVLKMHIPSGKIESLFQESSNPFDLGQNIVTDLFFDNKNTLWAATFGGGLCKIDAVTNEFTCVKNDPNNSSTLLDNQVFSITQDSEGHLWVGTWNGVSKMNLNMGFTSFTFGSESPSQALPRTRVNAIFEDKTGMVWIGSESGGLVRLNVESGEFRTFENSPGNENSLSINSIWSITGQNNNLWIGTGGGGLNRFDLTSNTFRVYRRQPGSLSGLSDDRIYSVFLDNKASLWIGTVTRGINNLVDPEAGIFMQYAASDEAGALSSNDVWPIFQDEDNVLWIGTLEGGLNRLDIDEKNFTSYSVQPDNKLSISSNSILAIEGDQKGHLWIGTMGNGLNRFDKSTGAFYHFTESEGLAHNEVSCILTDHNQRLWIGTRNGLSVFDQDRNSFINLYVQNGLPSASFRANACHKGESGRFYFGTDNGLVSFYPDSVNLHIPPHRVLITELQVNNEPVFLSPHNNELTLNYNQNTVGFRVAAFAYSNPSKNTYYYQLSGSQDTSWIPSRTGDFLSFNNLDSGNYTLNIKAKNSFGVFTEAPLSLALKIKPPFWKSGWFLVMMSALVLSAGTFFYRLRVSHLLEIARKDHESKLAIEKLRINIAADFHDGMGSILGALGLDIDLLSEKEFVTDAIRQHLRRFREQLNRISAIRGEMSWMINSRNDSLEHLVDRIRHIAYEIVPAELLLITAPASFPPIQLSMEKRRHLIFFIREALHNAIKHAHATLIQVVISEVSAGVYTFLIRDNGCGFDPAEITKGEGLDNLLFRAESIGGTFEIHSVIGEGTTVSVTVKMDDSSYSGA